METPMEPNREYFLGTPGFSRQVWQDPGRPGVGGSVLFNEGDPVVTHVHQYPGGVTLSTYREGQKPERWDFR